MRLPRVSDFKALCLPAKIYFVLSILAVVLGMLSAPISAIAMSIAFILLYTLVLNYFCSKNYSVLAWAGVIIPFVINVVALDRVRPSVAASNLAVSSV